MCGGPDIFQQAGDALASIDPGPSIGNALASVDKAVNDSIPGGWITVGGLALGGAAASGAFSSSFGSSFGSFFPEAVAATEGATPLTTAEILSSGGFTPAAGSGASFAIPSGASYTSALSALNPSNLITLTPGADSILAGGLGEIAPAYSSGSTFGSLSAAPSTGAFGSLNPAIPAGVGTGTGFGGTSIGGTYALAGPGQFALNAAGNPILAGSGGFGIGGAGLAAAAGSEALGGLSLSDLNNARKIYNLANQLTSDSGQTKTVKNVARPGTTTGTGALGTETSNANTGSGSGGSSLDNFLAAYTLANKQPAEDKPIVYAAQNLFSGEF